MRKSVTSEDGYISWLLIRQFWRVAVTVVAGWEDFVLNFAYSVVLSFLADPDGPCHVAKVRSWDLVKTRRQGWTTVNAFSLLSCLALLRFWRRRLHFPSKGRYPPTELEQCWQQPLWFFVSFCSSLWSVSQLCFFKLNTRLNPLIFESSLVFFCKDARGYSLSRFKLASLFRHKR